MNADVANSSQEPAPRISVAATQLLVDAASVEVVSTLEGADVEAILLKGPSLSLWLYDEPASRSYSDCDLLVSPSDLDRAGAVLSRLGYVKEELTELKGDRPLLSHPWTRSRDGAVVDLHHGLPGAEAPLDRVWELLSASTEPMELRGGRVSALNEPARAMHVALHAAQHGGGRPVVDLAQALERLSLEEWRAALDVARSLDAVDAFAQGLSLLAKGKEVMKELGVQAGGSVDALLRSRGSSPAALNVEWFLSRPTLKEKAGLVWRKMFPPPAFLRARSNLAKRGPLGLALAYVVRPFSLAIRFVPGFMAWYRARRDVKEGGSRKG